MHRDQASCNSQCLHVLRIVHVSRYYGDSSPLESLGMTHFTTFPTFTCIYLEGSRGSRGSLYGGLEPKVLRLDRETPYRVY